MEIEFDSAKDTINIAKHGISLYEAEFLEWDTMLMLPDERKEYYEDRFIGYGKLNGRLHAAVITFRNGKTRIISLRKANKRESKLYEETSPS